MDDDIRAILEGMGTHQAGHLPVVAAFLKRIGLSESVNVAVPSEMAVDIGTFVSRMVLDALSGRSPIYRLAKFASSVDTGLLPGSEVPASAFNDTTVGRALDAIYEAGTEKVFSQVAFRCGKRLPLRR